MATHKVERYRHKPLEFSGKLLSRVETDHIDGERWLQLKLYERVEGGFVSSVTLCTTTEGEESVTAAEQVDTATDVEDFFFAFEPDEFLHKANVKLSAEQQRVVATDIYEQYEPAVRLILAELTPQHRKESGKDADDVQATENSKFVGLE